MTNSFAQSALKGLRVLIVEDRQDTATSLDLLLTLFGCDTCVTRNGNEALACYPEFLPEAVLLDLGLPGMDGWQLAARLRRLDLPQATLIAVSGFGSDADRERSRQSGIDVHLLKPARSAVLRPLLENVPRKPCEKKGPTDRVEGGGNLSRLAAAE